MKRITFALVCAATMLSVMTGCKAKKEAYYAASERAKAQQEAMEAAKKESDEKKVVVVDNNGIRETKESIQIISTKSVSGNFGVVVGSFTNRTNAEGLLQRMQEAGYPNAVLGRNNQMMYRVIVNFHAVKSDAQAEVGKLRSQFPDAWILVKE